jgi:hypothetical protein
MELLGIFIRDRLIRFGDADDFDIVSFERRTEEAFDVSVYEAYDGDAERLRGLRERLVG